MSNKNQEEEPEEDPDTLKEKGNNCVKNGKYTEAILHYTFAIKLDSSNALLYSNRSLAFLKVQQYHFALEDAKETIRLRPDWAKGYFRKAEVEFHTFHFSDAMLSYTQALKLQPDDRSLLDAIVRTSKKEREEKRADAQIPWVGAGIGIFVGVLIILGDQFLTPKPTVTNPFLMVMLTISVAMVGYGIARGVRYYIKCQRESLLEAPPDLFGDNTTEKVEEEKPVNGKEERTHRYTKAQARQRYKKGKS